jgi:hypothetical protein
MANDDGRPVRIRTAQTDKKKALDQYQDLRRAGRTESAVVVCDMKDGSLQILGQGKSLQDIAVSLVTALRAIEPQLDRQNEVRPEAREEPVNRGEVVGITTPTRAITTAPDGTFQPPPGENFISCGECAHPRWYVLNHNDQDIPARFACAACGNEIILHRVFHGEGNA